MKGFRYILFTSIMFLLFINVTNAATCVFGTESQYLECSTSSGGSVDCEVRGGNLTFADLGNGPTLGVDADFIERCEEGSTIYAVINVRTVEHTIVNIFDSETAASNYVRGSRELTINQYPAMKSEFQEEVNTDLSAYNGNACIYTRIPHKYVCTIVNGKPVCEMGFTEGSYGADNFDISNVSQTLTAADFLDENGNFTCTKYGNDGLKVCTSSSNGGKTIVSSVGTNCNGASLSYSPNTTDFEGNPGYNEDEENDNNNEGNTGGTPDAGNNNTESEVVENFCTGSRLGVFTTIGWVFFFAKILIPIILIIFGSIDVGKAVIASKDDEIKKSMKTLVMRIVAGIIIFFVPTIINLIVELINGGDLYNGDFATCTHCLLEPTDSSVCTSLVGD